MRDQGVELCIVGPADNLRYLLGCSALPGDRLTVLVVAPTGAVMIMPDFEARELRDATFDELGVGDVCDPTVVDDDLPFGFLIHLRDRITSRRASAGPLFAELRMVKSAEELERIARTGELVSEGSTSHRRSRGPE